MARTMPTVISSSAVGGLGSATPAHVPPHMEKYCNMRKLGLPLVVVMRAMERDGVVASTLELEALQSIHADGGV